MAPGYPAQCVADLIAIELGALGDAEVRTVLQAREPNFVSRRQPRRIGHRIIRAEGWDRVQEPIPVED